MGIFSIYEWYNGILNRLELKFQYLLSCKEIWKSYNLKKSENSIIYCLSLFSNRDIRGISKLSVELNNRVFNIFWVQYIPGRTCCIHGLEIENEQSNCYEDLTNRKFPTT